MREYVPWLVRGLDMERAISASILDIHELDHSWSLLGRWELGLEHNRSSRARPPMVEEELDILHAHVIAGLSLEHGWSLASLLCSALGSGLSSASGFCGSGEFGVLGGLLHELGWRARLSRAATKLGRLLSSTDPHAQSLLGLERGKGARPSSTHARSCMPKVR
ncbi:hypothetical protein Dimus_033517 [Dionaea muscipula]